MRSAWLAAVGVLLAALGTAEAGLITDTSSFSGGETVITFDSHAKAPSITLSGVTFVNNATTGDLNLESKGPFDRAAFFARVSDDGQLNNFTAVTNLDILFGAHQVNRAGFWVSNAVDTEWRLEAFDSSNTSLGFGTVTSVQRDVAPEIGKPYPIYAAPVFIGFESTTDIARLNLTKASGGVGQIFVLDDLHFEGAAVPEPTAFLSFAVGGLAFAGVALRKRLGTRKTVGEK